MFSKEYIEKLDASGRLHRKANEQYLPAYEAFWLFAGDVTLGFCLLIVGLINAGLVVLAGHLLGLFGFLWLIIAACALLAVAAGVFDAASMVFPYYQYNRRTSYGSSRWADLAELKKQKMIRGRDEQLAPGAISLGRVFGKYDLILPKNEWLRHIVFFGPTGSGKTKTFFMSMMRSMARHGSCLTFDPKGELFEQTAGEYRLHYRLDLLNPECSDRWNFLPLCRGNDYFANSISGMMLSLEVRAKSNQDPFWGNAEQVLLTAILLHIAECYPQATPAFAFDFVAELDAERKSERIKELQGSPSVLARKAMEVVNRTAPQDTLGSILLGLSNKLKPFTLEQARRVMTMPTDTDLRAGVKLIDFSKLREQGTAVYIVVPEGATEVYKEFLATFFGQAIFELRTDGSQDPEFPCLVLIDEARELDVAEVRRVAGIGRGRGIGMALSYQDYPQVFDQYGENGAKAILETMMTKIFLPGVNGETAEYASNLLGKTTIFTDTSVDYEGTKQDNTRRSETGRALMMPDEVRQMPKYGQLLMITDTLPPIKAQYPPIFINPRICEPARYALPLPLSLSDVESFSVREKPENSESRDDIETSSENSQDIEAESNNSVTEFCDEQINNYDGDFYATVETRRAARNAAASSQQLKIKPQTIQTKTMIEDATLLETVSDVQDDVLDSDKDIYDEFLIDDDDEAVLRQTDELQPDSVVESEAVELSVSYVVPANEIEELKESNLAEFSETALIFDDKF
jgi:type IV secretory pathway TraG/TraD family ATPase VirD4